MSVFIITGAFSVLCIVISVLQFLNKGVPLNNDYLFAAKQERENMDTRPLFRQSAIVFLVVGIVFAIIALEYLLKHYG